MSGGDGCGAGWLEVWSDGASRGNPGPAGIGALARDGEGRIRLELFEYLGEATNNVAEYMALVRTLEKCADLGFERVRIHSDSELMVQQLKGGFRVKSRSLAPLVSRVKRLLEQYREVEILHVPREENRECDTLANRGVDEGMAGRLPPLRPPGADALF